MIVVGFFGLFFSRIPSSIFIWLGCFTFAILNGFYKISLEMIGLLTVLMAILFGVERVLADASSKKGSAAKLIFTVLKISLVILMMALFTWKVFF